MLKRILKYSAIALVVCYLVVAFAVIPGLGNDNRCNGILMEITEDNSGIIDSEDIKELLKEEGLDPNGMEMDSIRCYEIERFINSMSLVKECQIYKTQNNYINSVITCRRPIIKVIADNGETYCIDEEGVRIEGIQKALYLPVATGHITDSIAMKGLNEVAVSISRNRFWKAQIEQVHFKENGDIVLVPRVGNHIIELGTAENVDYKLEKLYTFYSKGLGEIGWNKYSIINIEYADKVICTRRE